jgi:hypothetical protein
VTQGEGPEFKTEYHKKKKKKTPKKPKPKSSEVTWKKKLKMVGWRWWVGQVAQTVSNVTTGRSLPFKMPNLQALALG